MAQNLGQEFKITKAEITAERLNNSYDMKQMIGEISFFEDLQKPYVSAQLVIMDDAGVFDLIKIKGTEQIEIVIEAVEDSLAGAKLEIKLNIVSIVQVVKGGDRSEIYHMNCISPHAYRDQGIKISRSYKGKLEDITEAILKNHLNVRTDRTYLGGTPSVQQPVKIITPYISPLESAEWLVDRATSDIGAPFYIWSTLYDQQENGGDDVVRIGNLEYMINSKEPFNAGLPLLYSSARGQEVAGQGLAQQARIVKELSIENIQNQFKVMQEGAVGSLLSSFDTYTSQTYERHFSVGELLQSMEDRGMLKEGKQNVFDDKQNLEYEDEIKPADQWNHRYLNTVSSFGTYRYDNSYHDVFNQAQALSKIKSSAMKSLYNKNMITLKVPGVIFFAPLALGTSGATVGDIIDIHFKNTNVEGEGDEELNKELSGTYLIHMCRNIFTSTRHDVIISVSKVADFDGAVAAGDNP